MIEIDTYGEPIGPVSWIDESGPYKNEVEFRRRIIPQERFVEYEPSDLEWMIPLGMAPEIPVTILSLKPRLLVNGVAIDGVSSVSFEYHIGCQTGGLWIPGQD